MPTAYPSAFPALSEPGELGSPGESKGRTPSGRKTLAAETSRWEQLVQAIGRVMKPVSD